MDPMLHGRGKWLLPALIVAAALALASCGDDDHDSNGDASAEGGGELFTLTSGAGTLEPGRGEDSFTLTLTEPADRVTAFADRPVRSAETETVADFVDSWSDRGFEQDPPNAAPVLDQEVEDADTTVFEISDPQYDDGSGAVSFTATRIEDGGEALPAHETDEAPASFGDAHLFVDPSSSGITPIYFDFSGNGGQVRINFDSPWQATIVSGGDAIGYAVAGSGGGIEPTNITCKELGEVEFALTGSGGAVTGTAQVPSGVKVVAQVGDGPDQPVKNGKFSLNP